MQTDNRQALTEALGTPQWPAERSASWLAAQDVIRDAARDHLACLDGEIIRWCEFHNAQGTDLGFCWIGATPYSDAHRDCSIVSRRLSTFTP